MWYTWNYSQRLPFNLLLFITSNLSTDILKYHITSPHMINCKTSNKAFSCHCPMAEEPYHKQYIHVPLILYYNSRHVHDWCSCHCIISTAMKLYALDKFLLPNLDSNKYQTYNPKKQMYQQNSYLEINDVHDDLAYQLIQHYQINSNIPMDDQTLNDLIFAMLLQCITTTPIIMLFKDNHKHTVIHAYFISNPTKLLIITRYHTTHAKTLSCYVYFHVTSCIKTWKIYRVFSMSTLSECPVVTSSSSISINFKYICRVDMQHNLIPESTNW